MSSTKQYIELNQTNLFKQKTASIKMENKTSIYFKIGGIISYTAMFFIFTTMLYFILSLTHRLPESWNYASIIITTFLIILIGKSLKYWMEKQ